MTAMNPPNPVRYGVSRFTEQDVYLFRQGTHARLYNVFGAHHDIVQGDAGTQFAVWAPNAQAVSVIGDFNGWRAGSHPLRARDDASGIWEGFIPGVGTGTLYKYHIQSRLHHHHGEKADPFAFSAECPPRTASKVADLAFHWDDDAWLQQRQRTNAL
ncbi:MAG: 1,4-alpha-glucan branching enzyme, partial [Gammaproteobacteria bacterium]|nr:1,4-alpha-glucan branching enzyme [Gammaproteobacteria bacterium]